MFIKTEKETVVYMRLSKKGKSHEYKRTRTVAMLRCDCCHELFTRPIAKISPIRLSNNYFHVCDKCDAKKFAQSKGAERRTIWNRPANSEDDISTI